MKRDLPTPSSRTETPRSWLRSAGACLALAAPVAAATLAPTPGHAQEVISASPDVTISVGGVVAAGDDVVVDNQLGIVLLENLGALPVASDVIALGTETDGDRLIAFDTTVSLPGGVVARKGDVVRTDGATYAIVFDASVEGLPPSAATDAVSLAPGGLLLSFDTTVSLPGNVIAADEDLVVWDGANFTLVFDGSAEGVGIALDVDGAQALGAGTYLLSFDTSGSVGGVAFADEDLVRFDGANFSLETDMTSLAASWGAADLDAVLVPEPGFTGALLMGAALIGLGTLRRRQRTRTFDANGLSPLPVALGLAAMAFAAAGGASAADGVLEINQTCAEDTGCFPGDSAGFPVQITEHGSYRLTGNLVVPDANTTAISIESSGVTLDLGGFDIARSDCAGSGGGGCPVVAGNGSGIEISNSSSSGLTVRNGSITGMGLFAVGTGSDSLVEAVRARRTGTHGISAGTSSVVSGCTASRSRLDGIQAGPGSIVRESTAYLNGATGIDGSLGTVLESNVAYRNVGDGISAGAGSTVVGNTSYDNEESGITAGSGVTVARNTTRLNDGFGLELNATSAYRENTVTSNGLGTVSGGVNMFSNSCDGSTTCP